MAMSSLLWAFAVRRCVLGLALLGLLAACNRADDVPRPEYGAAPVARDAKPHYTFTIHPLHNPQLLHQKFDPLMNYLGAQLPQAVFDLQTSNDYADFEQKLRGGSPHFALPNPYHAMLARDWGYHVVAKMANDEVFRGVIIVRKDSPLKQIADLKGKVVAYPAPTALAAAMMPQLFLQKNGIDVDTELHNKYVGTHNSSLMNAYLRESDASATWPVAWAAFQQSNPREAAELKLMWQTPTLIQNAIIARNDLPPDLVGQVAHLLTHLQDSPEGRGLLHGIETEGFVPASDQDFEVVRTFLKEFNTLVKKQAP
jgi:phosphonate transport system substrate-binding protein